MIIIAVKLATSITYTADGSQTNFSVPFDYLRPSYVHVAINDAEVSEGFTISNRMVMFDSAPTKDAAVHIYRSTPTTRLVSWADASILKAIDMTIAEVQQLHILEETNDWTKTNSIVLNDEGNAWQGRNYRLTNIADPVDEQDAVTKRYIDNEEDSFTATMNALKNQTEQMANQASTNANNAKKSETAAKLSETNAKTSETNAKLSETNAKNSETAAKTAADSAGASKEAAQSAASTASNYASASRGSANEAQTYKTNAQTYMNNAELYMNNTKNYSENVNVFIPSVSSAGVLSWTNKAGLPNPASVNIKGIKGDKGDTGEQGVKGDKGDTGATGAKGDKGNTGAQGAPATIRIGTVTTGEPGTEASVTNSGTRYDAIFDFVIPRGYPGSGGGSSVDVDYTLSATSLNPIANKAVYNALLNKVETADMTEALNNKLDKTGTALYAQMDSKGYNIYNTYARKTDITGMVKSVNGVAPDTSGNVTIEVGGTSIIVDSALSATSENPVQNKVVYNALANKMNTEDILSGFALLGGATNIRWCEGTQFIGSINAANYSGTARAAIHDGAGNNIVDTYAKKTDISGVVKSVNGTKPDTDGNVTIDISGGSGVSTSESNTWTAQQNFRDLMLNREKYTTYVVNGTSDTPVTSTMVYAVTGAFTLNLATLAGALKASESSVFTAYFAANADYSLTINNAGKLKYVGSASDVAITSSGLLLNIWMSKDGGGTLTSIVQANKLA